MKPNLIDTVKVEDILIVYDVYDMILNINHELEEIENLYIEHKVYMTATGDYLCINFMDFPLWDSENGFEDIEYEKEDLFYVILKKSLLYVLMNLNFLYVGLMKAVVGKDQGSK